MNSETKKKDDGKRLRAREIGIEVGILPPGELNAITDVKGVNVGHKTVWQGDSVRTGVTVVVPHDGNLMQEKVPAAVYTGNGHGKSAGFLQVEELGNIETPIALTSTLSVGIATRALIHYMLEYPGNENIMSVNAVVGETNDAYLSDVRQAHLTEDDFLAALRNAKDGVVEEGSVGAGTGTACFGFKGGIGTASRQLPDTLGGYTLGVLVQSNYGGVLTINGAPVGRELGGFVYQDLVEGEQSKGSCMIVVATDAPLSPRNLKRIAKRAILALGRTGSYMGNGSGDFVIAFSTAYRIKSDDEMLRTPVPLVLNRDMNSLFMATVEATEEALYNSMFKATTVTGREGHTKTAIPLDKVIKICKKYNLLNLQQHLPSIK